MRRCKYAAISDVLTMVFPVDEVVILNAMLVGSNRISNFVESMATKQLTMLLLNSYVLHLQFEFTQIIYDLCYSLAKYIKG